MERCYACNKPLPKLGAWKTVHTEDGQSVFVGPDCFKYVQNSSPMPGYQPPLGGPKLFLP